ncbi:hypothetical protein PF005_g22024 [Phytophthora fragariae]|uniref:B30.2/SPRY domain-containing protein n=1 Tax=Phytophthora fragariae TaxID=53985 RepID=A0A6A3X6M7_9STRA|nr:hypothetical protein PF003_g702 [Phytophthora fragariae]KAE8927080.1 hypothetical protein PF009_g22745 [Phytophthora fragariae]KAE8984531.1 hypothetical protein PF011_g20746 [Phytophthora fragariae]KAE9083094.1 hypothetical protein PF007_g22043 [Phytophthora fragariae]KAE9119984.1 hypothetical protein PF010_g7651 [Phytophthora fragariae]
MSPSKQLRTSACVTLAALAPLLEFLDARGVATLVCTQKTVGREGCAAIWFWLVSRTSSLLTGVELPRQPPHSETLQFAIVLPLLRQLQAVASYNFDLHFDAARHGGDVYLVESGDCYVSHWGPNGGSMFGDRECAPGAVSYWECAGLSEGSYVGIAEVISQGQAGFQYYGVDAQHLKRTLSLPTPACDHMPAVMYCEGGFVTTGSFRGPKPQLPARVNFLDAGTFKEEDRVGVVVDLLAGFLLFVRNGEPQGMRIPIDRSKKYLPVFSACACYNLQLIPDACPPWSRIYSFVESCGSSAKETALLDSSEFNRRRAVVA